MMEKDQKSPIILCILDGWGIGLDHARNAITRANLPNWNRWIKECPHTQLSASGESVGLPEGQMGNSEVGHTTIGAGRVILQDLPRITKAFEEELVETLPQMTSFLETLKSTKGRCHVLGLVSPGGVHSHQSHLEGFLKILNGSGIETKVHCFLDGRDTPPQSAKGYMSNLQNTLVDLPYCSLVTMMGRFYGMDRDKRWDRTKKAFDTIVHGEGIRTTSPEDCIDQNYQEGVFDEFIPPVVFEGYEGIEDGDALLMVNFRADRVQQILSALLLEDFTELDRGTLPKFSCTLGMKSYSKVLDPFMPSLFPKEQPQNTLGAIMEQHDFKQLRAAETEKFAHVSFFFNGGKEAPYEGEDRLLVPSPKVQTYDLKPEMSARELTQQVLEKIESNTYDLVVLNFANPDMVGHTGNFQATLKAVEVIDECLGKLASKAQARIIITADHGNAEEMGEDDKPCTAHSTNLVPLLFLGFEKTLSLKPQGGLKDIAPTLLDLMNIPQPKEMTGCSLID